MIALTIRPDEIRVGDRLLREDGTTAWTALADATVSPGWGDLAVEVKVEHADGGHGPRYWSEDSDVRFTVVSSVGARSLRLVNSTKGDR